MSKVVGVFVAAGLAVGALVLAYAVGVPPGTVLAVGAGTLGLLWLLLLLTAPWNLYFRAHAVLAEITVSREKGIAVAGERDGEARRIARVMLRVAVAGHVVTAAVALAVAAATGRAAGYWFAGFFLLSTFFRPAGSYFGQLRRRLRVLLREVTFPRDDVVALTARVAALESGGAVLDGKADEQYRALAELRRTVDAVGLSAHGRADETDRRIAALAREFEATVNRLTDNEEIITGLKAFLRLLRATDSSDAASVAGAGGGGPAAP
ncbi:MULTISPECIES: hypothetical protein [unclassified Streptomyces]|uniref:hypothetical protein n=1 Tax=unclassified Streptomyces TaxID=2593676 RepID=UPI0006FB9BF2|nr:MULTISPECIES: hypothetical protein [unclassified Streptomyces]KQX46336.1 hypothetical protein ASD33_23790 [Streptomyces sp. Root1304]KRA81121.1 hypothetical protein ASE09_16890 [Streptomyces sp. Root66D1]